MWPCNSWGNIQVPVVIAVVIKIVRISPASNWQLWVVLERKEKKTLLFTIPCANVQVTHAFVFEWFVSLAAQQTPFQSPSLHLAHVTLPGVSPHGCQSNQLASQVPLSPLTPIPFWQRKPHLHFRVLTWKVKNEEEKENQRERGGGCWAHGKMSGTQSYLSAGCVLERRGGSVLACPILRGEKILLSCLLCSCSCWGSC